MKAYALLLTVCIFTARDVCAFLVDNVPLSAAQYQSMIGTGFSTDYFKNSQPLSTKYTDQNIVDVANAGFKNLRLRCRADLPDLNMVTFLTDLERVVDTCIRNNVAPIISWIHHEGEAHATETQRQGFINWWTQVAKHLKHKSHLLSFNLFTELGIDKCGHQCQESLRTNTTKYNIWTKDAVRAIRQTHGNNTNRIIILTSPIKTVDGLHLIDSSIYKHDPYMLAEWHTYASGPNKNRKPNGHYGVKYWEGNGDTVGKHMVDKVINHAKQFTASSGLLTYFGAWMPQDNGSGSLNQSEVTNFAKYFVGALKGIPWSLNALDVYYDTHKALWLTGYQDIQGQRLNMSAVLEVIKHNM